MRHIRRRVYIFAFISALGTSACVLMIAFGTVSSGIPAYLLLAAMVSVSAILAVLCVCELSKLKIARLIAENPILHIRTAVISDISAEAALPEDAESTEVIVSYFGILLDAKIIKFNQDGIRLRAVEIGDDYISFTCDAEKRTQKIRLLRPAIDPGTMKELTERFRYETGITPTLLS